MTGNVFTDVRIETERLIIRPYGPSDDQDLHELISQPEVREFIPDDPMTLEEVRRIIVWLGECYPKNTPEKIIKWTLAMVWRDTNKVIGSCGLGPLDFSPDETELFYALRKEFWGRGLATEAARAVLKYAFETIRVERLVAVTMPANVGSVKVIEKLGFRYEKKVTGLRGDFADYEGDLYYTMTRDEYLQL
jgi:ribosomal-protein-alanine N-acetyltransferase